MKVHWLPCSLSLLRFGRNKCLPYWIFAGTLLQLMCFYCCRQIVRVCRCGTRLQQAPLTAVLSGLVGSLLRGHQAGRGTVWQTPLLWSFTGDHMPCTGLFFVFLLLTWVWIFSHIWPLSLWLNYLVHIAEVARSRVGETLPWQGQRGEGFYWCSGSSCCYGKWFFICLMTDRELFFGVCISYLENSIFINSVAFTGHPKG